MGGEQRELFVPSLSSSTFEAKRSNRSSRSREGGGERVCPSPTGQFAWEMSEKVAMCYRNTGPSPAPCFLTPLYTSIPFFKNMNVMFTFVARGHSTVACGFPFMTKKKKKS